MTNRKSHNALSIGAKIQRRSMTLKGHTHSKHMSLSFLSKFLQSDFFVTAIYSLPRLIMRPSYKPHYASCRSVRLSRTGPASNSKTKKRRKTNICIDVPTARVSGVPIFSSKGQISRSQDVKTSKIWRYLYLRVAAPADQARLAPTTL